MQTRPRDTLTPARAAGRCVGAKTFSVFGVIWLLFSCAFFKQFALSHILPVLLVGITLFVIATRLKRQISPYNPEQEGPQKKHDDRVFGLINLVTYTLRTSIDRTWWAIDTTGRSYTEGFRSN